LAAAWCPKYCVPSTTRIYSVICSSQCNDPQLQQLSSWRSVTELSPAVPTMHSGKVRRLNQPPCHGCSSGIQLLQVLVKRGRKAQQSSVVLARCCRLDGWHPARLSWNEQCTAQLGLRFSRRRPALLCSSRASAVPRPAEACLMRGIGAAAPREGEPGTATWRGSCGLSDAGD
jgi:hypothetical protein